MLHPPPPADLIKGAGASVGSRRHAGVYKPLRVKGQGDEPSTSNFFSEYSGSGTYTDAFAYTSGVSVSGGGGGGLSSGSRPGHMGKQHVAFGKISKAPPPLPAGTRRNASSGSLGVARGVGGPQASSSLRRTSSLPPEGGLPPVGHPSRQVSRRKSPGPPPTGPPGFQERRGESNVVVGKSSSRRSRGKLRLGLGGGSGEGDDDVAKPGPRASVTRRGKLALNEPNYTADEIEMMQLKQDLERLSQTDMTKEERRRLYRRIHEAEQRHGKVGADGTLDPAAALALKPKLTEAQEEAARRNCPPRDPRLRNPDDSSDDDSEDDRRREAKGKEEEEEEEEEEKAIGSHRDRDWRPIVAKACMALQRIDNSLKALDHDAGPDPEHVAAAKEGLPEPVSVAADGETPMVFEKEHEVDYSDSDDEETEAEKDTTKGDLIDKLVRDAGSEEASAEEKAIILQRMLDAASVQEAETAKSLKMMDRLMHAMCLAEAEKGVAAATSSQIKRQTELSVAGMSLDDEEMSLDDAVSAVRTITVTTGDLSFDMFRSLINRLVPDKTIPDHVFCSLYLDARSSAGRIMYKTFKEAAITVMEMDQI